jgi:hypothetical protein
MRAWRGLKTCGAAVLRDGVYLMPEGAERRAALVQIETDIGNSGGIAWLLGVNDADYPFAALFDRTGDYQALAGEIAATESLPGAEQVRQVRRLRKAWRTLAAIDFFPGEAQRQTEALLAALETRLSPHEPHGGAGSIARRDPARYQGRRWATRCDLWVDRIASAWLIRRFIDPAARFLWLDHPGACPPDAVGFDFDGAEFSHVDTPSGTKVTFETLLTAFGLEQDTALARLAAIVHCLDAGGLPVAEAAGLERLLHGIKGRSGDDAALLDAAAQLFDDLYRAFQHETTPA